MKILIVTENPSSHTGMAKVGGEIAKILRNVGHEIVYLCCGSASIEPAKWPFKLIARAGDSWGKDIFDDIIYAERPEVVLTIGDPWFFDYLANNNICRSRELFQWVGYIAIDGEKIGGGLPNFWAPIVGRMDKIVAYTNYGRNALLKSFPKLQGKIDVIYHGVDESVFYPLSEIDVQRNKAIQAIKGKFVFLVVARNQGRKNWPELFKAWKIIHDEKLCPNAMLWPHTYFYDRAGHNMDDMLDTFGLSGTSSVVFFQQIARGGGFTQLLPMRDLNGLYNMADALISVGGEGFGLPVLEAMATKVPCIVLNHSATSELGAEGRAFLAEPTHYLTGKYLTERPVPSPKEIIRVMERAYNEEETRKNMSEKAYKFAMEHTWSRVGKKWELFFDKLETPTKYPMVLEEVTQ